ncbi:hypothetical protein Q1695_006742 [Nippostrongylus brasiliensis]|nr:hypothetical protein Q1695_006742 [Nippostrongylus brasiliensis]
MWHFFAVWMLIGLVVAFLRILWIICIMRRRRAAASRAVVDAEVAVAQPEPIVEEVAVAEQPVVEEAAIAEERLKQLREVPHASEMELLTSKKNNVNY